MTQTMRCHGPSRRSTADGSAEMTQTIDRVRTKIETAFGGFEYDSEAKEEPRGAGRREPRPPAQGDGPRGVHLQDEPAGRAERHPGARPVVKALARPARPARASGMFSEEGLKNMIPSRAWSSPATTSQGNPGPARPDPDPPVGTMSSTRPTPTGARPRRRDHIEKITLDTKVEPQPAAKSNIDLEHRVAGGQGDLPLRHRRRPGRQLDRRRRRSSDRSASRRWRSPRSTTPRPP